jgi:hypothetical protein
MLIDIQFQFEVDDADSDVNSCDDEVAPRLICFGEERSKLLPIMQATAHIQLYRAAAAHVIYLIRIWHMLGNTDFKMPTRSVV